MMIPASFWSGRHATKVLGGQPVGHRLAERSSPIADAYQPMELRPHPRAPIQSPPRPATLFLQRACMVALFCVAGSCRPDPDPARAARVDCETPPKPAEPLSEASPEESAPAPQPEPPGPRRAPPCGTDHVRRA